MGSRFLSPQWETHLQSSPPEGTVEHAKWLFQNDPNYYFENALKIVTKGKLLPFKPRKEQRILINIVRALRIANLPVRIIILKSRRLGMSTAIEGLGTQETTTQPFRRAKVVAHDEAASKRIFNITRVFYDELDPDIKPMARYSSTRELTFENPDNQDRAKNPGLRSQFTVATAGGKAVGRGEEVTFLHLSEIAFYDNPMDLATGLLGTVDDVPGTSVFMESTANGVGNYFHDMYWDSLEGKEELISDLMRDYEDVDKLVYHLENFDKAIGYLPLFFSWTDFPEYRSPVSKAEAKYLTETLDEEESRLIKEHKCDLEQIKWRRGRLEIYKDNEAGISPIDFFKQEFPSTDREAFIATGRNVFSAEEMAKMKPKPALFTGRILTAEPIFKKGRQYQTKFMETPYGELKIYVQPKKGRQYAIGGDVAFAEKGRDFSCLQILDKESLEHCAEWHGKTVDPDELGKISMQLGSFYNRATVAIERNNMGIASIIALRDTLYPFIYVPKTYATRDAETPLDRLGWETSSKTKAKAIADLKEHVRRGMIKFNSPALISECMSFKIGENGRLEAEEGKHDDRVMAMAIALQCVIDYPAVREYPTIGEILHKEKLQEALVSEAPASDSEFGDVIP